MDVNEFAQQVLAQQKARLAEKFSQWQADAEQVQVIPGPKYTKVDLGTEGGGFAGKFMIENATGEIYGIKGYGRVHKGHRYGTLDTVGQWDWSDYYPRQLTEREIDARLEQHRQDAHGGGLCDCARKAEGRDGPSATATGHSCPHCGCQTTQQPAESGPYTHIVKRADGYIAGWFRGEPPADFVAECNKNVPGNPAHVEVLDDEWPESFTDEMRSQPAEPCRNCGGGPENGHMSWCGTAPGKMYENKRADAHRPEPVDPELFRRTAPQWNCVDNGGPHYTPYGDCAWCGKTSEQIAAEQQAPRYDHEYNDDGSDPGNCSVCHFYHGSDPATQPVTGAPLPDVAARRAETARMRDGTRTRHEIDSSPETPGNPYAQYTPEHRVFEIAQRHGQQAAEEAIGGLQPDQEGYRILIREIPVMRTRPGSSASEPKLRRDDLPGYAVADLMSQAGWVPNDGTMLRDALASQYESQAATAFWNGVEQAALTGFRGHAVTRDYTQLGNRFLECACGHRTSGGVGDDIARLNMDHHIEQVHELRRQGAS